MSGVDGRTSGEKRRKTKSETEERTFDGSGNRGERQKRVKRALFLDLKASTKLSKLREENAKPDGKKSRGP